MLSPLTRAKDLREQAKRIARRPNKNRKIHYLSSSVSDIAPIITTPTLHKNRTFLIG